MRITTGLAALLFIVAPVHAADRGKALFLRCQVCHAITRGAPARMGPNLAGVVGRKAAIVPGYAYSPALKARALMWNDATLDRWLARPSALVPGTKMIFAGLPDPADRRALIAYLKKPT